MKKTVLFGLKMDTNIGDYLIGYNLQYLLSERFPNDIFIYKDLKGREKDSRIKANYLACVFIKLSLMVKKLSLCNSLEKTAFLLNNKGIKRFYKTTLKDADTVVFAGGGLIECEHYGCHQYIRLITEICEKQGIDIIYNAVGFNGEYKDTNGYRILKECLNSKNVKAISVRENINELRKYTNFPATLVCDPACYCFSTYGEHNDVVPCKKVGIGLIRPDIFQEFDLNLSTEDIENVYVSIIRELERRNIEFEFFTNGVEADFKFGKRINSIVKADYSIRVPRNDVDFMDFIQSYHTIVGARMHACIVSYAYNVPAINICWNKKLKHFFHNIGLEDRCIIPNKNNTQLIIEKLMSVIGGDCENEKRKGYLSSLMEFLEHNRSFFTNDI